MSWRDNLIEGAFRNVTFHVEKNTRFSGRKAYINEWEGTTKQVGVWSRDLGAKADEFQIEAFIVQNNDNGYDYFDQRDKLIDAIKEPGPGILYHPSYGVLNVQVIEHAEIEEDFTDRGGEAKFSIRFAEVGKPIASELLLDYLKTVDDAADAANARCSDNFLDKFKSASQFVNRTVSDAQGMLTNVQTSVYRVTGSVQSTVNSVKDTIAAAIQTIATVASAPCDIYNTMKEGIDSIKEMLGMAGEVISDAVQGACSGENKTDPIILDGSSIPPELGESMVESLLTEVTVDEDYFPDTADDEEYNRTVVLDAFKSLIFILLVQFGIRIDFNSQDDMISIMNKIADAIEAFVLRMGSERSDIDNYENILAMQDLKATFVTSMIAKGANLNKEVDYKLPPEPISSIEIAYDLYEDIDRESEIITRNKVKMRHPAFSFGTIKVLDG